MLKDSSECHRQWSSAALRANAGDFTRGLEPVAVPNCNTLHADRA